MGQSAGSNSPQGVQMKKFLVAAVAVAAVAVPLLLTSVGGAANAKASSAAVCPGSPVGSAHCHALVATDAHGNPDASASPTGLAPGTIKSVYNFPTGPTAGAGQTIAIVD